MNFGWDQEAAASAYAYQFFGSYESAVPSIQLSPELEPGPWPSQPLDPLEASGWHSDPQSISCTLSSSTPAVSSASNVQHIPLDRINVLSGSHHSHHTAETDLRLQYSHYNYNTLSRPNYVADQAHQEIYVNNDINTRGYQVSITYLGILMPILIKTLPIPRIHPMVAAHLSPCTWIQKH